MIYKIALCDLSNIEIDSFGKMGLIKTASGRVFVEPNSDKAKIIEAEIEKHPTALFFRAKAIKANEPNSNGDYFSEEELIKSHKTFEGVPFFTNHDNQNIENARGKIIFAEWIPEEKAVYTIAFVDREAFPHICRSIEEEYTTGVSMGAVNGDSVVIMSDLSEKKISDIQSGDEVLTPYGNKKMVKMVHNEYIGKPMYSFDLVTYHKSPMFTEDHPIFTIEKSLIAANKEEAVRMASNSRYNRRMGYIEGSFGQDTWRHKDYNKDAVFTYASKIQEGDFILIPSKFKIEDGASLNSDFYYVVGAYMGDGFLKKDKNGNYEAISFCLGLDEIELAHKITDILKKYSKREPCDLVCEDRNGLYINLYDREMAKWFADNIGSGSKSKRIKFNLKFKDDALNLLAGYLDTDGCIAKKKNNNYSSNYQISSANLPMLEDIQSLLIAMGCVSRISSFNRSPSINSVVKINTTEHTLAIGSNNSDLFNKSIKFINNNCEHAQIKAGKTFVVDIKNNKFMACPVKNINVEDFREPVYDITVEDDECYIADGMAVHNCSVDYSICNICQNRAEKMEDYCMHIREKKGRKFSGKAKNVITGEMKEFKNEPVFEYNYGIKFIELSAVVDPACSSCHIEGIIPNDEYIKKIANFQNTLFMIKTSAIEKNAGQEEVTQLNSVLETLEKIAINLIQNRQQVEVEFASDLVGILSDLQKFVDELVGAGYGNVQNIPGIAQPQPQQQQPSAEIPPATATPPNVMPVAEEKPIGTKSTEVGSISGSPTKPLVKAPQLPITSPAKPRAFDVLRLVKVSNALKDLSEKMYNVEEMDMAKMGKRRTVAEKIEQKKVATEILSNSWKEKQQFLEYIIKVPSIQNNYNKLSVRKRDDTFIIVAEEKSKTPSLGVSHTWTYEDLSEEERRMIKESPKEAAQYLLNTFSNNLKNQKEGVSKMSDRIKEAGAKSVNKSPETITESQLEQQKDLYHPRTDVEQDVITEKQLNNKDVEQEVITEAQLESQTNKLNPRTKEEKDVITQKQLETSDGVSPRKNEDSDVITQKQLDENRVNVEQEVITEKQLYSVSAPWERAAGRNPSMFKSAGDHMSAVIDAIADASIITGCTPQESCKIAGSLIGSTKDRYELANAILDKSDEEDVDYAQRLAYWSKKNIKVAGVGSKEIAETVVRKLRKVVADTTINPEVILDAIDVISEENSGIEAISNRIDAKLAEKKEEKVRASVKSELRNALKGKESREEERKEIIASVEKEDQKITREAERAVWEKKIDDTDKKPDRMIETSFEEIGCSKKDPNFRKAVKSFVRGALASRNIKLAAITNVTIDGDTISIAVQTNEGDESVEIPVDSGKVDVNDLEVVPEGDLAGEGLENALPPQGTAEPSIAAGPVASNGSKMSKKAQAPMGGGIPQAPGEVAGGPGAPEAGLPGATPVDEEAVESLTAPESDTEDLGDEIPTAGEQQMPYAICPECGSSDVDIQKEDGGNVTGNCKNCGAGYEALVKKEVEFIITKPSEKGGAGEVELPEVPALPVAAQTKLNKNVLVRIASNKEKYGHVCPACGMNQCKTASESGGHIEYKCPACGTDVEKDIIVNVNNPEESYQRVAWTIIPKVGDCENCKKEAEKFASLVKIEKMIKNASNGTTPFPMANCVEKIARIYGGNSVSTFGHCKGKPLADCVCKQLEKLGMSKVRHLEKLAATYMQKDPMDECIEDFGKKGYNIKEAKTLCGCLKKKFASEIDDNPFVQAFEDDIKTGKEKILTAQDLRTINDFVEGPVDDEAVVVEESDVDLADVGFENETDIPEEKVTIEVSKETAQELANAATEASEEVVVEVEEVSEVPEVVDEVSETIEQVPVNEGIEEKEMALSMQTHKLRRVGEKVVQIAATPKKVEDIEGNVEAGVPRAKATMGKEGPDNIDVPMAKPSVPRANAEMGKEGPDNINKPANLPDVAVDSAYMGGEKAVQGNMPAINNEIKGTVIAEDAKTKKQAKQLKEVDTVEKDVDAGVPRAKATMGKEGPDNVDVPMAKPSVPRANAEMGKEGPDNINPKTTGPDVPVDDAYMGDEKNVQKSMPPINDEYLKQVQQKKEVQLERIASARRQKASEVAYKLLASSRITEEAYDHVVEALSSFEIDKIASKAEVMYPRIKVSSSADKDVHAGPAIVLESKPIAKSEDTLTNKLASAFTIGNKGFDEALTRYGEK